MNAESVTPADTFGQRKQHPYNFVISQTPATFIAFGDLLSGHLDRASAPTDKMPAAYEIRAGGDVKNKKQSMNDLKLRRLNELNSRLREDLERPRIKVSEASMS